MAATEAQSKAIGGALQALVTNASNMAPDAIDQITEQILLASAQTTAVPVVKSGQVENHDGNPSEFNCRRSRAGLAGKKADKTRKDRVKLRPLNAFICFRSYYSPIFAGLTQKTKSGLIRQLWENDNWKHFWSIEAKAYSDIRDAHLEKISLDKFLTETVGLLGVIPADEYLPTMGWELVICEPTEYHLVRKNPASTMQNTPLSTNLSAADIVTYCYEIGLVKRPTRARISTAAAGVAMAFAAHPSHPKIPTAVRETQTTGIFTDEHGFFDGMTAQTEVKDANNGDQTMTENVEDIINVNTAPYAENLSIQTATVDVQRALEEYPDEYPYAYHFHPAVDQPILAFDPTVIQDDFDPFDMADFIDFDI